jgi:hypothetical protein
MKPIFKTTKFKVEKNEMIDEAKIKQRDTSIK